MIRSLLVYANLQYYNTFKTTCQEGSDKRTCAFSQTHRQNVLNITNVNIEKITIIKSSSHFYAKALFDQPIGRDKINFKILLTKSR